jgi:hypothetical protein
VTAELPRRLALSLRWPFAGLGLCTSEPETKGLARFRYLYPRVNLGEAYYVGMNNSGLGAAKSEAEPKDETLKPR